MNPTPSRVGGGEFSGVKVGALVQPCRVACTGRLVGPSLYHLLEVLGREKVAKRVTFAATH